MIRLADLALKRARRFAQQANAFALASYLRLIPTEQGRVLMLTIVIGGVCGFAAVLFHLAIRFAEAVLIEPTNAAKGHWWILGTILVPTLGALLSGFVLDRWLPTARGSGIPQVKAVYAIGSGRIRLRDAVGKLLLSTLQIGSGSSLGREGPTVFICAG